MARTNTRVQDTGKAIDALLRLTSKPGAASPAAQNDAKKMRDAATTVPSAERVRYLLDAPSIQRLFGALSPSEWVPKELAAAYLNCSVLTFERRVHVHVGVAGPACRTKLEGRRPPDYAAIGRYRWGFVRTLPRTPLLAPAAPKRPSRSELMELYELVQQKVWFIAHRDGAVLGAVGQAHLSVQDLMKAIKAQAIFKLATPLEALTMPWVSADAREPWAKAVDAWWRQVSTLVARGQAMTEALEYEALVGSKPARERDEGRL